MVHRGKIQAECLVIEIRFGLGVPSGA